PDQDIADPAGFLALDFVVVSRLGVDADADAGPGPPAAFGAARGDARRALDCGGLGEHLRDVRAPLTPRRFVGNIVDAVRLDGLRVPTDPAEARRRLCGDDR
ncbi:MAG TPA: hypothetical protein VFI47_26905, partial [Acidimicrobiales bacterium]|nr:hypothetical protein [Acidimicrobiales bacterium]